MPSAIIEEVGKKELARLIPAEDVSLAQEETVFKISVEKIEVSPLLRREIAVQKETRLKEVDVVAFLEENPKIKKYLPAANAVIKKYFPSETIIREVTQDPDSEIDNAKTLFFYIVTNLSPKQALAKLEKLDEEIFTNSRIDPQLFNINLKFQK